MKFITGFGGVEKTQEEAKEAFDHGDLRWAIELSCVLIEYHACSKTNSAKEIKKDSEFLANCLRTVAQRTTASNIRNWCLTHALELEGFINLERHRKHRFSRSVVVSNPPSSTVHALRVLLDPNQTIGYQQELRWNFDTGETTGLLIRNDVAVPTDGKDSNLSISLSVETWADLLAGKVTLSDSLTSGMITTEILKLCNTKLAGYKRPKSIDFVEELPRTGTGKILKRTLREPYWEGHERQI